MTVTSPLLLAAIDEARTLAATRGWTVPSERTQEEAQHLLDLALPQGRAPTVLAEPDGTLVLEWEAGASGWLRLSVAGRGTLEHSAVIEGDDYAQVEDFSHGMPQWAAALLARLLAIGH